MRFIYADSLDFVDPLYDFIADRSPATREQYWHDLYPHEILGHAPYGGLLVSRAIVDGQHGHRKYSQAQAMRFRLVGAREFLRFPESKYPDTVVLGDCGAFSYHTLEKPPYTPEEVVEFYDDAGFTHGCSVDHVIFEYDESVRELDGGSAEARRRFEITLDNAQEFLAASRRLSNRFTPIGVIQGWSPASMAFAAERLVQMGYSYLAVGGMVPLKATQVHSCLDAIRDRIGSKISLHILGFAKADSIHEFVRHNITSFDTTSPLTRAFKDSWKNYYLPSRNGKLSYYTAVRVPQALENTALTRMVKSGRITQEKLLQLERAALEKLRGYDRGTAVLEETLEAVLAYSEIMLAANAHKSDTSPEKQLPRLQQQYERTLRERPWRECACAICAAISIEVIIFRSSNRNKRRGIHNIDVFGAHLRSIKEDKCVEPEADILCH